MWFNKRKNGGQPEHDQIARSIADKIIKVQHAASDMLNIKVNRYGKRTQLRWFWMGCVLALLAVICSVSVTFHHHPMPKLRSGVMPSHIGKSSDGIPIIPETIKDSVNAKNKAHGNNQ